MVIPAVPGEKSSKSTELGDSSEIDREKDFSDSPETPAAPGVMISPGTAEALQTQPTVMQIKFLNRGKTIIKFISAEYETIVYCIMLLNKRSQ